VTFRQGPRILRTHTWAGPRPSTRRWPRCCRTGVASRWSTTTPSVSAPILQRISKRPASTCSQSE
jgi:hypothetical protein